MKTYVLSIACALLLGFTAALLLSTPKPKPKPVKCSEVYVAGFTMRIIQPETCVLTRRWT